MSLMTGAAVHTPISWDILKSWWQEIDGMDFSYFKSDCQILIAGIDAADMYFWKLTCCKIDQKVHIGKIPIDILTLDLVYCV